MQPLRDTPRERPILPDLPRATIRRASYAASRQLQVAPNHQVALQPEAPKSGWKIPGWVKTVGAVAAAGAVGVGVSMGLGHFLPSLSGHVTTFATAMAGAGTFYLTNKWLQPKPVQPPATTQEEYEKQQAGKNKRAWFKSGVLAVGALLATGAFALGIDLGLKAVAPANWAASIQTAISPALWGFTNAIAGAVTFLFIQKVTEPVGAFISRWAAKGSPIVANYVPAIIKSFIDINEGANAVNSLALSGAISVNSLKNQLQDTVRDARQVVDEAEHAWTPEDVAAKIKRGGSMIGRTLIATETLNFSVTPEFPGVMKLLHEALGAYFEDLPEATRAQLIEGAVEAVKARRPTTMDPRVPTTEAALKTYYVPMLEGIINGKIAVAGDAQ